MSPNESPSPHHVGGIAGTKNHIDKGCDPVPAQPADRAGAAPHPGEDFQVFHFAELGDRSCSPVTFVVGSLGSPLAVRWEVSTSLLKTRGVRGVGFEVPADRRTGFWVVGAAAWEPGCWAGTARAVSSLLGGARFPHRRCLLPPVVQDHVSSNFSPFLRANCPL